MAGFHDYLRFILGWWNAPEVVQVPGGMYYYVNYLAGGDE